MHLRADRDENFAYLSLDDMAVVAHRIVFHKGEPSGGPGHQPGLRRRRASGRSGVRRGRAAAPRSATGDGLRATYDPAALYLASPVCRDRLNDVEEGVVRCDPLLVQLQEAVAQDAVVLGLEVDRHGRPPLHRVHLDGLAFKRPVG